MGETNELQRIENLAEGKNTYNGRPFWLWLSDGKDKDKPTEENPCRASWNPFSPLDPTSTLRIDMWDGVPEKFRPVLIAHELREVRDGYSHQEAVQYHMEYARKFLSPEDLIEFVEWQSQFEYYRTNGVN